MAVFVRVEGWVWFLMSNLQWSRVALLKWLYEFNCTLLKILSGKELCYKYWFYRI